MSIVLVFILVVTILIIGLIQAEQAGLFIKYKARTPDTGSTINVFNPTIPWGKPVPYPGDSGVCHVYTMYETADGIAKINYPYLETCISEGTCAKSTTDTTPFCLDFDQLYAGKAYRICTNGSSTNAGSGCIKRNGTRARINEDEAYWRSCASIPVCPGQLGLIDLSRPKTGVPSLGTTTCITSTDSATLTFTTCTLADQNQFFRMERFNMNGDTPKADSAGIFCSITHRKSGLVLAPVLPVVNGNPQFNATLGTSGVALTLINPTLYNVTGIWWMLAIPETALTITSSQQILYIGLPASYPSFTTATQYLTYAKTKLSLRKTTSNEVKLVPFVEDNSLANANAQFYNATLYKTIAGSSITDYEFYEKLW